MIDSKMVTGDKRSLSPVNQPEMKKEKIDGLIRSAGIIQIPIRDEEEHMKKNTCKPCRKVFTRTLFIGTRHIIVKKGR